jgi:hypothetical protein
LPKIISDYGGSIDKLLLTNVLASNPERQIVKTGLWENFLKEMKKTGFCPEIYVINAYRNDYEKKHLMDETDELDKLVKISKCVYVKISNSPTATQDICTVLDSNSFILAGPSIDSNFASVSAPTYFSEKSNFDSVIKDLLCMIGFKRIKPKIEYSLEGGYVCATQNYVFFSNPKDKQIMNSFRQAPIFVEDFLINFSYKLIEILYPHLSPNSKLYLMERPAHVDLILSAFEKNNYLGIFYSDFKENELLRRPINRDLFKWKFDRAIGEMEQSRRKLFEKIEKSVKKEVVFYEMPGIINFVIDPVYMPFIDHGDLKFRAAQTPGPEVYSGTNLLFHSVDDCDYAFYLKYPKDLAERTGVDVNQEIESSLKKAGFIPIPIAGTPEESNYASIYSSAGMRCLVKVLSRS